MLHAYNYAPPGVQAKKGGRVRHRKRKEIDDMVFY